MERSRAGGGSLQVRLREAIRITRATTPAITTAAPHDHCCLLFDGAGEREAALTAFARAGLDAGQKVVCLHGDGAGHELLAAMSRAGIDTGGRLDAGDLELRSARDTYLTGGGFDAQAAMDGFRDEASQALADGYSALRCTADMSWALDSTTGDDLLAYERELWRVFDAMPIVALCQYDRELFGERRQWGLAHAHPRVFAERPVRVSLSKGMLELELADRGVVRLRGEADVATASALREALELATDSTRGDLSIDASELTFIDLAGVRILDSSARRLNERGGRLEVAQAQPALRRIVHLLETQTGTLALKLEAA